VTGLRIVTLDPAGYRTTPWKNGGGVSTDIADAYRSGAAPGDWRGVLWRFGRTTIAAPAPFSDLTGFDRIQVVVRGRSLVLETHSGEIDLREPFRPARFRGEPPILSCLEAGPVEVVNLIGARADVRIDMRVLRAGEECAFGRGMHVAYARVEPAQLTCGEHDVTLSDHHALRIEVAESAWARCARGIVVIGSIDARA
jgi:environmental stress-induced protein Ves